ncbi:hypothetical protein FB451DRAFT_1387714 [Mycena latifolia]|nr:hypothetical protein FB451DRAFT_1387714 [Mycena latifolia]
MVNLHGRNGLQVMGTLLWWGDVVGDKAMTDPFGHLNWTTAVTDVTWVLGELLRPGIIKKTSGGRKRKADETGDDARVKKSARKSGRKEGDDSADGCLTRSKYVDSVGG